MFTLWGKFYHGEGEKQNFLFRGIRRGVWTPFKWSRLFIIDYKYTKNNKISKTERFRGNKRPFPMQIGEGGFPESIGTDRFAVP